MCQRVLRQMETACIADGLACNACFPGGRCQQNARHCPIVANLTSSSSRPTSSLQPIGQQHSNLSQPSMGHAPPAMYGWHASLQQWHRASLRCCMQLPRPNNLRDGLGARRHLLKAELGARRGCAGGSLKARRRRQSGATALVGEVSRTTVHVAASCCTASWKVVLAESPTLAAEVGAESSGYTRALAPSPAVGSA